MESRTIWKGVGEPSAASAEGRASVWVGALPAICAVHCLAMPILASTLPFFAATHAWEGWLVALSALLVALTLGTSWRLHGRWSVSRDVVKGPRQGLACAVPGRAPTFRSLFPQNAKPRIISGPNPAPTPRKSLPNRRVISGVGAVCA